MRHFTFLLLPFLAVLAACDTTVIGGDTTVIVILPAGNQPDSVLVGGGDGPNTPPPPPPDPPPNPPPAFDINLLVGAWALTHVEPFGLGTSLDPVTGILEMEVSSSSDSSGTANLVRPAGTSATIECQSDFTIAESTSFVWSGSACGSLGSLNFDLTFETEADTLIFGGSQAGLAAIAELMTQSDPVLGDRAFRIKFVRSSRACVHCG